MIQRQHSPVKKRSKYLCYFLFCKVGSIITSSCEGRNGDGLISGDDLYFHGFVKVAVVNAWTETDRAESSQNCFPTEGG